MRTKRPLTVVVPDPRRMMRLACLLSLPALAHTHGAMTQPSSRNAIDGTVAPWCASSHSAVCPGAVAPWRAHPAHESCDLTRVAYSLCSSFRNGTVPEAVPFMFWCAAPDASAADPRKVPR